MNKPEDFDTYEEYVDYFNWVKRQKAKTQSMENIKNDQKGYSAASGGGGQNFEIATPFGRIDTGLVKSQNADRALVGIKSGLQGAWDRTGNLLLPKSLEKGSRYSEEAINARRETEQANRDTTAGMLGEMGGQIAATAPIGLAARGVAAGGEALVGANRAAQAARQAAQLGKGGALAASVLEGAGSGAALSDPGEGGSSALTGGLLSGGMTKAGQIIGAGLRAARPEVTEAARTVMDKISGSKPQTLLRRTLGMKPAEDKGFIPISQSLPEDSVLRAVYSGIVGSLPGDALRSQRNKAVGKAREILFDPAVPHGTPPESIFEGGFDNPAAALDKLDEAWSGAWDEINPVRIVSPAAPPRKIIKEITKNNPMGDIFTPVSGAPLDAGDLIKYRNGVQSLANRMDVDALNRAEHDLYTNEVKRINSHLKSQLAGKTGADGADLANVFEHNSAAWNPYQRLKSMATRKSGAEFTMHDAERVLAKESRSPKELLHFARAAEKSLRPFPSNMGIFQMAAALGALGYGGYGASQKEGATPTDMGLGALKSLAIVGMAGRGASSKVLQKRLAQYAEKGGLDRLAPALRQFGSAARRGAVAGEEEKY